MIHLDPIGRFPGLRVLAWDAGLLYAVRGYALVRWTPGARAWDPVAVFDPGPCFRWASASRLCDRFLRGGYHALARLQDGGFVAVFPKTIGVLRPGDTKFQSVFRIPRGTGPLTVAATPTGWVYWGEYFDNPSRDAVHVYGSPDGVSWQVVFTFPPRNIRHVHSITYDRHAQCLWVLTGDDGGECRILRASLNWSTIDAVLAGNQQARAITLVPRADALYFATDTPIEENHIYRLDRGGSVTQLASIEAYSFWSCGTECGIFFSTALNPSRLNGGLSAVLYGSADGDRWGTLARWRREPWPMYLSQYASIILPAGDNNTNILAASGSVLRHEDRVTHLWRVRIED
jgi:hypothetical protein